MKLIKEIDTQFGTAYEVWIDDKLLKTINYIRINKTYKDFEYLFIIDENGTVLDDVYNYINDNYKYQSINTRKQIQSFLKLLYSFAQIINKDFKSFNDKDIDLFSLFITGEYIEGNTITFDLKTTRSISTHNKYFDNMRGYFKYLNIKNKKLFEQKIAYVAKSGFGMMAHAKEVKVLSYTTNKGRHVSHENTVPKHIKLDEYFKIIKYIDNLNISDTLKTRNRLIIELMYGFGLRIGEVLGLTIEDIEKHPDSNNAYNLILRNRLSDMEFQHAKGCDKVKNKHTYLSSEYNTKDKGYQVVVITDNIKYLLDKYINMSCNVFHTSDKVISNIAKYASADNVTSKNITNRYIFLNKNGAPLSYSGWNKFLKTVFVSVGISIDKDKKKDSLSHRFRHGYAMLLKQNGYPLDYIQYKMRHTSISSTQIYARNTEEDILENTIKIDKLRYINIEKEVLDEVASISSLINHN